MAGRNIKKPNYFIIGAPKCGTTALSEYLRWHDDVFMCFPKEPHHFDEDFDKIRYARTREHYLRLFEKQTGDELAVGEGSVWYLHSKVAVPKILEFNPDARFIVMLRNPADLAYSMHAQFLFNYNEDEPDFAKAWALQDDRLAGRNLPPEVKEARLLQYREIGRLGEQVQRLFETVPRERVLCILFEDFTKSTREVYKSVLDFLEVPDDGRTEFPRINLTKVHSNKAFGHFIQRPPKIVKQGWKLAKRVFGDGIIAHVKYLRSLNMVEGERTKMPPELRAEILATFADDIDLLGELLERDLSHWKAA